MFAAHNMLLTGAGKKPVTFQNISTGGTAISSATWNHTVPANASVLIVVACLRGAFTTGTAAVDGVSMTKVKNYAPRDAIDVYAVLNPTPGVRSIYAYGGGAGYGNYFALTYSDCGSIGTTYTSYATGSITFDNADNSANLFICTDRNSYTYTVSPGTTRAAINGGSTISSIIADLDTGGTITASSGSSYIAVGVKLNGL